MDSSALRTPAEVPPVQNHRNLRVYRKAHIHALRVRKATTRFPNGYPSLKLQLIRSVESISLNIVEGCGAQTRKEFARFGLKTERQD